MQRASPQREPQREPQSASELALSAEPYNDIRNTIQKYKNGEIDVDYLVNVLHTKMIMSDNKPDTLLSLTKLLTKYDILEVVKRADTTKKVFQDGGNRRKIKRRTRRSTYRKLRRSTIRRR